MRAIVYRGASSPAYRDGALRFYWRYAAMMNAVERTRLRLRIATVEQFSLDET